MSRPARGQLMPIGPSRRLRRARAWGWLACSALALTLVTSGRARAQAPGGVPASDPPVEARPASPSQSTGEQRAMAEMLFSAARTLMDAGRYKEACTKLAESYRLDPAAGTLLNLAVCHEKDGKIASAWGEFRHSILEAQRAGRSDREELARTHASALEPELPFLAFEVPSETLVPGLQLVRNGVQIQAAAWGTELPVDPGEVQVVLSAPGYMATMQTLVIERGEHRTMKLAPLLRAPMATASSGYWTTRRTSGLGLLVGGVLSAATGMGAGFRALRLRDTSNEQCPSLDGERRCSVAGANAMSSARKWALASDLTLGVGALGAAVGAYLFATGASGQERRSSARRGTGSARWSWDVAATRSAAYGTLFRTF